MFRLAPTRMVCNKETIKKDHPQKCKSRGAGVWKKDQIVNSLEECECDENGVLWYKSWNKTKLCDALMKCTKGSPVARPVKKCSKHIKVKDKDYVIDYHKKVGSGLSGQVFSMVCKENGKGCEYIVKQQPSEKLQTQSEEKALRKLKERNFKKMPDIIDIYDCKHRHRMRKIFVMEKFNKSLLEIFKKTSTAKLEIILNRVVKILKDLHSTGGAYHGDTHLDNFMVTKSQIVIIDFGKTVLDTDVDEDPDVPSGRRSKIKDLLKKLDFYSFYMDCMTELVDRYQNVTNFYTDKLTLIVKILSPHIFKLSDIKYILEHQYDVYIEDIYDQIEFRLDEYTDYQESRTFIDPKLLMEGYDLL